MAGKRRQSPSQDRTPTEEMTFGQAMEVVQEGKRVTRVLWNDTTEVVFLHAAFLHIRKADGSLHRLLVSDEDLRGTDWVVVLEN